MPLKSIIAFPSEKPNADGQREAPQSNLRKRTEKLARSGECRTVAEISRRLKSEGYSSTSVDAYLEVKTVRAGLSGILSAVEGDPKSSFFSYGFREID